MPRNEARGRRGDEEAEPSAPALAALRRLLRRAELAEAAGRPPPSVAWNENELTPASLDPSRRILQEAEALRAVFLDRHAGFRAGLVRRIRVRDARMLANFLGEERYAERLVTLDTLIGPLVADAPPWVQDLLAACRARWARGEAPFGLQPSKPNAACEAFLLLRGLAEEHHRGKDPRSFSVEAARRTKALEDRRRPVVAALRHVFGFDEGVTADEILRSFGLVAFPPPVLLRGTIDLPGHRALALLPYIGLPAELVPVIAPARRAPYLLCVENLTTFHRYVRDVRDEGIVLYAGGFPSRSVREAAARLAVSADRILHWGDIDPGGVRIFRLMETVLPGLQPHLMDPRLAETHGREAEGDPSLAALATSDSAIAPCAAFLARERTWRLEQEALAPAPPAAAQAR